MIMSILSGNLAEGQPQASHSPPSVQSKSEAQVQRKSADMNVAAKPSKTYAKVEEQLKVNTTVKFTFTMQRFIINLFTGGSKTVSLGGII